jgi:protein TonB
VRPRPAPLEPPQRIRRAAPEYPRFARINNIEGTVVIAATIDTDGRVTYPRIVKSFPMLDQAALDAVKQWEFKPGTRGGQPVPVDVTLSVEFSAR